MGRPTLICRLAVKDLRHRRAETVMLLIAITSATATLALALALNGVTQHPYAQTRAATRGPDVVASFQELGLPSGVTAAAGLAAMSALAREPGVTASSGLLPVSWPVLRVNGLTAGAEAVGRDVTPSLIDRPVLTQGSWVRPGGVVVERSFAAALGVRVGERLTLNGRPFAVTGIGVSAADSPYPHANFVTYGGPYAPPNFGTVWLTKADARSLATRQLPLSYLEYLRLANPGSAEQFETAHSGGEFSVLGLSSWQDIAHEDNNLVLVEQRVLILGAWLLGLLAVASVAVLVGGRMADQTRQVGLLKAVGGTPKLVASVLVAENLMLALVAAVLGLALGWLTAPLLTSPGSGLLGTAGAPSITAGSAGLVAAVALAVALLATLRPALRAARTSTVSALADAARAPRRSGSLIRLSRRLPVPLLLGLRMAARRPRRMVLTAASVTITVAAVVTALTVFGKFRQGGAGLSVLNDPRTARLDEILLVLTIALVVLAAANAVFITWAIALDGRYSSAVVRALGAGAADVTGGLAAALLLPAAAGAIAGIPAGMGLVAAFSHGGTVDFPSVWRLLAAAGGTVLLLACMTAIPARAGARRMPAEILGSQPQ
jgi:ABC-type antimicrobial peptide transport system permease subunit